MFFYSVETIFTIGIFDVLLFSQYYCQTFWRPGVAAHTVDGNHGFH